MSIQVLLDYKVGRCNQKGNSHANLQVFEFACPRLLRKSFKKFSDERERFLRASETDSKILLLKKVIGQKAFSYCGAKPWNSLERATKLAPSPETFKRVGRGG